MQPRHSIIEIFSTFVQFEGDSFSCWATESRLRRSMESYVAETPKDTRANFWVIYWYKCWQLPQSQCLAQQHLTAYLQECCYWSSQKTAVNLISSQYQVSDCFQIAISQVDKVLKGYNPSHSSNLNSYASIVFSNAIRETLRQMREVDICTDWGLLRKISQRRLEESLLNLGLSSETINAYILVWQCFKTLYIPTKTANSRQLSRPDEEIWQAIAKQYNTQNNQKVNPQILEDWLLSAAKAVRKYLYPRPYSDYAGELLDNIPGSEQESLIDAIVAQEAAQTRSSQQKEIQQVLANAIAQLEPQVQEILQLYYSQQLNQDAIAKQLEIKQYTVSRRLTKAKEILLRSLANWSQETLHISVNTELLTSMSAVIEEWLYNCIK
ncbi:sigma-70 family RNA polymerase sigma factor [Nodularia chucula]|uniref:sigma-70 family RNA polymerase sigma factor n=1 Tax=Nodularia chucula TaxID=3093667 RepID=UPI0039C6960F